MGRLRRTVLVVLVSAGLLPVVFAGEEEAKPSPADRYREAVAAFPAPSEADGFSVELEMWFGDTKIGTGRFSAKPGSDEGKVVWDVDERGEISFGDQKFSGGTTARLSRTLEALSGEDRKMSGGETTTARFSRTTSGYHLVTKVGEADAEEKDLECPAGAISSMSATILFCRLVGPEPAEYVTPGFEADPDDGKFVTSERITVEGKGEWKGTEALLYTAATEAKALRIALDPKTRAVLGVTMKDPSGLVMEMRPAGAAAPAPAAADAFTPPAKSPAQAALIAALAFGSGDGALLDAIVDWPSAMTALRAARPGQEIDEQKVRQALRARLDNLPSKKPRETVIPVLDMVRDQLDVKMDGESRAVVTFPPLFQNLTLVVGKIGDDWYLVKLPG